MTRNEKELLNIINQHSNKEQALEIAVKTILEFLEQDEPYQEQSVACVQELVWINQVMLFLPLLM